MSLIFLIFITLSPFSPFLFRRVDLWYAAGQYFQVGILLLLAYSFFENKSIKDRNIPLALLTLYLGGWTSYIWYQNLVMGKMFYLIFAPFFNFMCFLLFYKLSFNLNRDNIHRIIRFLSYSLIVYLFYCVFQFFDLDQFFKVFAYDDGTGIHRTVGLIGNETQNALYLAICLPVFYLKRNRISILSASLVWAVLAISGSASGIATALAVTVFFSCFHRLPITYYLYILLGSVGFVLLKYPELSTYISFSGRWDIWTKLWPLIKERSVFGNGLGMMNVLARKPAFEGWRHAHNEYYQLLFTCGIVGLASVVYCIFDYFQEMLRDRLSVTLASIFLGFCLASLFYFPAHLWMMATIGILSYSFGYVLRRRDVIDFS